MSLFKLTLPPIRLLHFRTDGPNRLSPNGSPTSGDLPFTKEGEISPLPPLIVPTFFCFSLSTCCLCSSATASHFSFIFPSLLSLSLLHYLANLSTPLLAAPFPTAFNAATILFIPPGLSSFSLCHIVSPVHSATCLSCPPPSCFQALRLSWLLLPSPLMISLPSVHLFWGD